MASTVTLARWGDAADAVTVALTHNGAGLLNSPASVSLAPGQTQATFTVGAFDNDAFDGDADVTLQADAAGYLAGQAALTITDDDMPPFSAHFDFGTGRSPVAADAVAIAADRYSVETGYGWTSGTIRSVDRSTGSALERDFNYTPKGAFQVDVPNGSYDVELILGDLGRYAHDNVGVFLEGVHVGYGQHLGSRSGHQALFGGRRRWERCICCSTTSGGRDGNAVIEALSIMATRPPLPEIRVGDVSIDEGDSGAAIASFPVRLSLPSEELVRVRFATANGEAAAGQDFQDNSGVLEFAPGETSKNVPVLVFGDVSPETNERFYLHLSQPLNATIEVSQGRGTIVNDDVAKALEIEIDRSSIMEQGQATGMVTRIGDTADAVEVMLRSSDTSEAVVPGSVVIAAGQASATFVVDAIDDDVADGTQVVSLSAFAANYVGDATTIDIVDDETPAFAGFYDFGTTRSPVERGYIGVSDKSTYSGALGYGWVAGDPRSTDRGGDPPGPRYCLRKRRHVRRRPSQRQVPY